jgi:hypothetical protein
MLENPEENKGNFVKYMSNPRCFTLKKWFSDMLKTEYQQHDEVVERISTSLLTDKDVDKFGKLIMNVYETAYKKAVEDYRVEFEKMGVKITIGSKNIS